MDDMIVDIGREYDIRSGEQHPSHWRCRFSIGSLLPQMKMCTMAPM
jgi:hypothetical protein